jgi:hypothetical protein
MATKIVNKYNLDDKIFIQYSSLIVRNLNLQKSAPKVGWKKGVYVQSLPFEKLFI